MLSVTAHPNMLVSFDGDHYIQHDTVNLGMAVALDDGLVVPCNPWR